MLKVCERLHWIDPEGFDSLEREAQALLIVFCQERELEEQELRGGMLVEPHQADSGNDPDDISDLIAKGHEQAKARRGG